METTVSLVQMLDARERRVQHQQELLAQYHKPLICFTMNICGPIKDSPLIRRGFARGRQLLRQQFLRAKLTPLYQDAIREVTGCEAFYVLDADPLEPGTAPQRDVPVSFDPHHRQYGYRSVRELWQKVPDSPETTEHDPFREL